MIAWPGDRAACVPTALMASVPFHVQKGFSATHSVGVSGAWVRGRMAPLASPLCVRTAARVTAARACPVLSHSTGATGRLASFDKMIQAPVVMQCLPKGLVVCNEVAAVQVVIRAA